MEVEGKSKVTEVYTLSSSSESEGSTDVDEVGEEVEIHESEDKDDGVQVEMH